VALAISFSVFYRGGSPAVALPSSGKAADVGLPIAEKSIAVLPFENRSEDKANAYFADGIQDEILTDLAKIADLKVISRTSVMQYKSGATRNLREIGQQLGVAHLLEGSVQRAANRVRVNAQLIDARTDLHLWGQTYDRDLADVFAIQSEIAEAQEVICDLGVVHDTGASLHAFHGRRRIRLWRGDRHQHRQAARERADGRERPHDIQVDRRRRRPCAMIVLRGTGSLPVVACTHATSRSDKTRA
jgi:TolB-like protein